MTGGPPGESGILSLPEGQLINKLNPNAPLPCNPMWSQTPGADTHCSAPFTGFLSFSASLPHFPTGLSWGHCPYKLLDVL